MNNTLRVADVMTADIHSVDGLATVADAVEAMRHHAVSSLVVARRHDGDEYGLVVVADIARKQPKVRGTRCRAGNMARLSVVAGASGRCIRVAPGARPVPRWRAFAPDRKRGPDRVSAWSR
ncbi:MAG: CBS domain-containing protein [Gammaproteobacteria bacterium]|nr:CBS domain-containing protein [Gammaproteobacteria bacterium]